MLKDKNQDFHIHRSFHGSDKKAICRQDDDDSEDDYGSGYDSSIAESHVSKPSHFYLDDDELILPIQSNHTHLAQRSLYGSKSPQISPSKSTATSYAGHLQMFSEKTVFPDQDEEQVCAFAFC